jgi:hypothetical protein
LHSLLNSFFLIHYSFSSPLFFNDFWYPFILFEDIAFFLFRLHMSCIFLLASLLCYYCSLFDLWLEYWIILKFIYDILAFYFLLMSLFWFINVAFLLIIYLTIHDKIQFTIRKINFPIHSWNHDLITLML